jgi:GT2 family glycosyltransferase
MESPLVFLVVLNWNGFEDTVECLESCRAISYPRLRLLVVDNGSVDGSEEKLRERFPDVELVQTGRNLGFAGGNNVGIRRALEQNAEYVLLLNNDTVVDEGFVAALVRTAQSDAAIGMLCPKIYRFDPPDVLWYAGGYIIEWLGWGKHRGDGVRDVGQFDTVEEINRPTGCALMVSSALCDRVGLLGEEYFLYCEDLDWGLRARKSGFKVVYDPGSRVWHKVSRSTTGSRSSVVLYYYVRNLLLCLDRNRPLPIPLRLPRFFVVLADACLALRALRLPKLAGVTHIWRGARDYFRGRLGELGGGAAPGSPSRS